MNRHFRQWSQFLREVRTFFEERDFLECTTPCLVPSPGTEPAIDFFELKNDSLYLRSSPELHLKDPWPRGKRVFELAPVFRRGEVTSCHHPEFLMLEWYRAYAGLDAIIEDVREHEHLELNFPARKSPQSSLRGAFDSATFRKSRPSHYSSEQS